MDTLGPKYILFGYMDPYGLRGPTPIVLVLNKPSCCSIPGGQLAALLAISNTKNERNGGEVGAHGLLQLVP